MLVKLPTKLPAGNALIPSRNRTDVVVAAVAAVGRMLVVLLTLVRCAHKYHPNEALSSQSLKVSDAAASRARSGQ